MQYSTLNLYSIILCVFLSHSLVASDQKKGKEQVTEADKIHLKTLTGLFSQFFDAYDDMACDIEDYDLQQWDKTKKIIKPLIAQIQATLGALSPDAQKKKIKDVTKFNEIITRFGDNWEQGIDTVIRGLNVRKIINRDRDKNYNNSSELIGILLKDIDPKPSFLMFNPNPQNQISAETNTALARGDQQEVMRYFDTRSSELTAQNEDGWTPVTIAASQGHTGIATTLLQRQIGTHFRSQETDYAQAMDKMGCEFFCTIAFDNEADDPKKANENTTKDTAKTQEKANTKNKATTQENDTRFGFYFVNTSRYRPFFCIPLLLENADAKTRKDACRRKGRVFLDGVAAYHFAKQLKVQALSSPHISVLDDKEAIESLNTIKNAHHAKLPLAIASELTPAGVVLPLQKVIYSYLRDEHPQGVKIISQPKKKKKNCVIQ